MIQSALATGNYFELAENTSALLCMSPNYIAGKMMLVRAIILGLAFRCSCTRFKSVKRL